MDDQEALFITGGILEKLRQKARYQDNYERVEGIETTLELVGEFLLLDKPALYEAFNQGIKDASPRLTRQPDGSIISKGR